MDIETISPLDFSEVTEVCRVSNRLIAECEGCGRVMRGGVHLCNIARAGFLCCDCCPACSGRVVLTGAELNAIRANRRRSHKEELEMERNLSVPVPVAVPKPKPKPKPKSKPGSAKQYWLQKQSKLIVRVDPSKAPRGGDGAKAFKMIQDGMPYLAAQQVVTQRFSNGTVLLANLRTRKAVRWCEA